MNALDTDLLISFLRNNEAAKEFISELLNNHILLCTTSINAAELYFGANLSNRKKENLNAVESLLSKLKIFPFTQDSGKIYGELRTDLQKKGEIINELDLFIAAIVIDNDLKLITKNVNHFEKIHKLKVESW